MTLTNFCGCTSPTGGNFDWTVDSYSVGEDTAPGTYTVTKIPEGFRLDSDLGGFYAHILTGENNFVDGNNYSANYYDSSDVFQISATESDHDYVITAELTNSNPMIGSITIGIYGKA